MFLGKLDLSDEVIVGTPKGIETTQSLRRMTDDRQWNPETLRMFVGVPWNPHDITTDAPGGIRPRCITRALVQAHGALPVKAMDKSMCQGVGNGLKTSLTKRNSQVNYVRWYSKTGQIMRLDMSCQVISVCKWSKNHNSNNIRP